MLQLRFVGLEKPPVWLVESRYVLGSDAACSLQLSGSGIFPRHAELSVAGEQVTLIPLAGGGTLMVDGLVITHPTPLFHNNCLSLGDVQLLVVDPKKQLAPPGPVIPSQTEWYLVSTTTALADKRFPIDKPTVVGRSAECDISLGVAHLSRRHARLWAEEGHLWVEDLGSANGTFVNGQRIRHTELKRGDLLGFDTLVFSVLGGPEHLEPDTDKTSLRPSLTMAQILAATPVAPPVNAAAARPSGMKADLPRPVDDALAPTQSSLPLWLGLLLVGFLTAAALIYFMS